jgi:isoquinoline 1-oxidoreductase beta subunit
MNEIIKVSRRDFVKTSAVIGGGVLLGFGMPFRNPESAEAQTGAPFPPSAFVHIGTDGVVTLIVNKSEMGQGVYTSLPMLVAEELECDWNKIRVEAAPVDPVYNHTVFGMQVTGGSTSVPTEWERMRKVGAAAREMLLAAAADTWKVKKESCRASNGVIYHASGRSLTYGQLSQKAAAMPVPTEVSLKDPSVFKIIGKPTRRLDTPEKVDGKALFGIDAKVPGVLIGLVARSPVFGGRVKSFNGEKTEAIPGVTAVAQIESGVAVVADNFWSAKKGRDALEIVWDEGPLAKLSSSGMRKEYADLAKTPGSTARKEGDPEKAFTAPVRELGAEYEVPYLAHATMEPLNCLVDLRAESCEIWTGTQFQTADRDAAARAAELKPEQVKIHTTLLGGGFGRRANPHSDFVVQAVQVAKAVKRPVKVIWTREDDMKGGYYRPMWYDRIRAHLDGKSNLLAWHHTIVGQSIMAGTPFEQAMIKNGVDEGSVEGARDIPYEIPNLLVDLHSPRIGVPVQWWRSVGHSHTAFVVESFMDEVAHAAGKDPYEFRRALLSQHPRHSGVLELAAKRAGWGTALPAGRGRGISVHESFGSFVAQVAEVSVSSVGDVRVHRVTCAIDCGRVVNPSTVEAQMESGIVFGLSAALHGAITLRNGRVEQDNFNDYPVVRMDEMPVIEVHIVPSTEAPGGVGEPGTPPIAAAVTNAIFAASGKKIRTLPVGAVDMK